MPRFHTLEEEDEEEEPHHSSASTRRERSIESLMLSKAIFVCTGLALLILVVVSVIGFAERDKQRGWRGPGIVTHLPVPTSKPRDPGNSPHSHDPYDLNSAAHAKFSRLLEADSNVGIAGSSDSSAMSMRLVPLTQTNQTKNSENWKDFTYFNELDEPVWLLHIRSGGTRIVRNADRVRRKEETKVADSKEGTIKTCQQIDVRGLPALHIVKVTPYIHEKTSSANIVDRMFLSSCQKFCRRMPASIPGDCETDCSVCTKMLLTYENGARSYEFPSLAGVRIGNTTIHKSLMLNVEYHVPNETVIPSGSFLSLCVRLTSFALVLLFRFCFTCRWLDGLFRLCSSCHTKFKEVRHFARKMDHRE
eukprot:gb/GECG01007048.1/.p1 GENE.gb/GECG01007048.1/~~gb/GECG01007048.1/.p1  ORF type:complete len:362 (+),score=22.71 gb/GECG01007048.1/:1-1086(+)